MDDPRAVLVAWREARSVCLLAVCLLLLITPTIPTDATTDMKAGSLNVSLYMVQLSQWQSEIKSHFQTTVVKQANKYCETIPSKCGVQTWNDKFITANINYTNGYPMYESPMLIVRYALRLPDGAISGRTGKQYYIPQTAVKDISINSRTPLNEAANVDIAVIDKTNYGPVPDAVINGLICGLVVLVCLILVGLVFLMNKKCGITPEPVEPQEVKEITKVAEENQNGATPVVTAMGAEEGQGEATPVTS